MNNNQLFNQFLSSLSKDFQEVYLCRRVNDTVYVVNEGHKLIAKWDIVNSKELTDG